VEQLGSRWRLTSQGDSALFQTPISRSVEAIVQQKIPPNFFDNAIWAAQNLDLRGNTYDVIGNVLHGDTSPAGNLGRITGTTTYDPEAHPLPRFSFKELYDMAAAQGNVYDEGRLTPGPSVFPTSFWFRPPTNPADPTTGIPNVNYVTTDLVLNGNIGTIGGFFVVVGNVLTDPTSEEDTTINGNGRIAGAVYTTGDFRVNGGAGRLNVDGGVWAGDEARLNGYVTVSYNKAYMDALRALRLNADVQILSWQDLS